VSFDTEILGRGVSALERAADALEHLAQDPVIQIEGGPPFCPHCERINPVVRVEESSAQGPLADFIIQAHCVHCNSVFYALPVNWECLKTTEEAKQALQEREEIRVNDNGRANQGASAGANEARAGGL
jgi:hypothetical protein